MHYKIYAQRRNISIGFGYWTILCQCCGHRIFWFNILVVLKSKTKHIKKGDWQYACDHCSSKVGITHVEEKGWIKIDPKIKM